MDLVILFFILISALRFVQADLSLSSVPTDYNDTLQVLGLLDSHFGPIDISNTFDYVIVGGGTAGLTLATRLAENGNTVAVIEAGTFYETTNSNYSSIPGAAGHYLGKSPSQDNPLVDWCQYTIPQQGFTGITKTLYPQGHVLGGSSARNFMEYQRGSAGTYDRWARTVGDDSYKWENMLAYFRKSVHFTPPNSMTRAENATPNYNPSTFDSSGGPLQVAFPNYANAISSWFARAFNASGMYAASGFTDGVLNGWGYSMSTIDGTLMTRSSSEASFLQQAFRQSFSLSVYTQTLAKRIIFDDQKRATAVQVETAAIGTGSKIYQLNATKEVIISAGSFRSPQMLMVSGIGPASTLESLNIPVVANVSGVGQRLMDQIFFGVTVKVNVDTHGTLARPDYLALATQQYVTNRTGILTNPGADMLAFEKLPAGAVSDSTRAALDATFPPDWPDVQYNVMDHYGGPSIDSSSSGALDNGNYAALYVSPMTPFSLGNVTINSTDTRDHPLVNPAWLTDPRDIEVAVAAFKRLRQFLASDAIAPVIIGDEVYPGAQFQTDEQIAAITRNSSSTLYHVSASNRMGPVNDSMTVVDTEARVVGVKSLRVVDASIFPFEISTQPQATVYALAEKIADLILRS